MKKTATAICLAAFILTLTACGNRAEEVTETVPAETTLPVKVTEKWFTENTKEPATEVSLETMTEPTTTEPTTTVLTTTTPEPTTTTPEPTTTTPMVTTTVQTFTIPPQTRTIYQTAEPKTVYVYETVPVYITQATTTETTTEPTTTTPKPTATTPTPTTTTVPETTPAPVDETVLVPSGIYNFADDSPLNIFSVTNKKDKEVIYDIQYLTLDSIIKHTGFSPCGAENKSVDNEAVNRGYFFEAPVYSTGLSTGSVSSDNDETASISEDAVFEIEMVYEDGELIRNEEFADIIEEDYDKCYVKAIHSSREFDNEEIKTLFYGGLRVGLNERDFYQIMGNIPIAVDRAIIMNSSNTMYVKFSWNTVNGEELRIIDEITLFNNEDVERIIRLKERRNSIYHEEDE